MANLDGLHVSLARIRRDGATNGQHITWSDSQAKWIPDTPASASGVTVLGQGQKNYFDSILDNSVDGAIFVNAPLSATPSNVHAETTTFASSIDNGFNISTGTIDATNFLIVPQTNEADIATEAGIIIDSHLNPTQYLVGSGRLPFVFYCTFITGVYDLHFRKALDVYGSRWSDRTTVATNIRDGRFAVNQFTDGVDKTRVAYMHNATGTIRISTTSLGTVSFSAFDTAQVGPAAVESIRMASDLNSYPVIYVHDAAPATDTISFTYQSAAPTVDGGGTWSALAAITTAFEATGNITLGLPVVLATDNTIAIAATQFSAAGDKLFFFRSAGTDGSGAYTQLRVASNVGLGSLPFIVVSEGNVGIIGSADTANLFRNGFLTANPTVVGDLASLSNVAYVNPGAGLEAVYNINNAFHLSSHTSGLHTIQRSSAASLATISGNYDVGLPVNVIGGSSTFPHGSASDQALGSIYLTATGLLKSRNYPGTIRYVAYE